MASIKIVSSTMLRLIVKFEEISMLVISPMNKLLISWATFRIFNAKIQKVAKFNKEERATQLYSNLILLCF
jgi:hypothetical protein